MRTAIAAVLTLVLVVLAVLLLSTGDPDPPPRPSQPTPSPQETASTPGDTAPTSNGAHAPATLVMWSRGELHPAVAEQAGGLPHVTAVAFIRSETLGLTGSRDADGRTVDRPPEGWRIPVDVVAVDPPAFAATLPDGPARTTVEALRPGDVLLPETSATLRGIGVGGEIDLPGRGGLRVAAVVPDGTVRNAAIVLHVADADAVGLEPDGSIVVRHSAPDEDATEVLRDGLRALVPGDRPARVVDVTGGGSRHRAPLVLSLLEVKSRFGEFAFRPQPGVREVSVDPDWVDRHIVSADVPILGTVRCHQAIIDDLRGALNEVVNAGLAHEVDPSAYAGCYHPRLIAVDRDRLSRHSWGIALDINVDLSQPGLGPPPSPEVVEILGRHGFRWGGDFLHADNHHFEWIGEEATDRPER